MLANIQRRFSHIVNEAVKLTRIVENDRILTVRWSDGHVANFPIIWLRDISPDSKTYTFSPAMTVRNLVMNEFDVNQSPLSMKVDKQTNELVMEWPNDVTSRYPSAWLRLRNPSCQTGREFRRENYLFPTSTWDRETIEAKIQLFEHDDVMNNDEALYNFLLSVCKDGLAVLKNGPAEGPVVEQIGQKIGLIHNTHFGKVFEVATKPDASNKAYATTSGLPFHTDFPSLTHPPQLQMLHMVQTASQGGNSLFVDGFHIAKLLKEQEPEVFDILSKYDMEYIEEGYDIHQGEDGNDKRLDFSMTARHRVIKLDDKGRVAKIQFGNAMRSWFYDCDPKKVQDIYNAMKVFTNYCYDPKNFYQFKLDKGDTVLWANTRVLHTRDDYVDEGNNRRLLTGCYFCWDIIKSRVRVLRKKLQLPEDQPSA